MNHGVLLNLRYYRQYAAKRQPAGIKIYSQAENQYFRIVEATRCTDSCETWQSQVARGSAWPCKISRQSIHGGGNAVPKTFWQRVTPQGRTL